MDGNTKEDTKVKTNKTRSMRVSINFKKLIQKLMKMEIERGNLSCSETSATEILYKRIQKRGGLNP